MKMDKNKRKQMETLIYGVFDRLDPSGYNTEYYKEMLGNLNDKEFDSMMKKIADDKDSYLILNTVDYEVETSMDNVIDAAKYLGCPLWERIVLPVDSPDPNNPIVTEVEVPVIYIPVKRMQQMVQKKNSASVDISKRDKYNQVSQGDKSGRSSDMENFGLVTLNADNILKEFLGPRADDSVAKADLYNQILENGYCSLNKITNRLANKTTLNYIDACLLAMGIKSDLITKGDVLKQSLMDE